VRPKQFLKLWYVWCKLWIYLLPILKLSTNRPKRDSTWATSTRCSNGCVQNYFRAFGRFGANRAPIFNQDYHYLQTNQNELPFEPRHLGVSSGKSKMISEPMVHLTQSVHVSCTETNIVSKWTEMSFHLRLVSQKYHLVHPKQFLSLWYVWRKPCTYHAPKLTLSPKDRMEILHDPCHLGVPSGASKMIYEAMVRLVQTVYLSWTETNTISKWTETRFYMAHVT
jgi:hypothetical protein